MASVPKILYRSGNNINTKTITGTAIDNPIMTGTATLSDSFKVVFKVIFLCLLLEYLFEELLLPEQQIYFFPQNRDNR